MLHKLLSIHNNNNNNNSINNECKSNPYLFVFRQVDITLLERLKSENNLGLQLGEFEEIKRLGQEEGDRLKVLE